MHWKLKLQRCGVFCHFRILCPWAWSWSAVSFPLAKTAADVLGFTPVSLEHLLLFWMCSCPPAHHGKAQWGNRPFSEGRWAQIWPIPSGFTSLHSRASMNLRDHVRFDWSGHERGEVRPTKSGLTVSALKCWCYGVHRAQKQQAELSENRQKEMYGKLVRRRFEF